MDKAKLIADRCIKRALKQAGTSNSLQSLSVDVEDAFKLADIRAELAGILRRCMYKDGVKIKMNLMTPEQFESIKSKLGGKSV